MSAKKQTAKKPVAKKPAAKPVAKPAAKKAPAKAAKVAAATNTDLVPDGTPVVFTELRTPIDGELMVTAGEVIYINGYNEDDKSYNLSKTPNGAPVETLYREEFRLATSDEIEAVAKPAAKAGKAAKAQPVKTDAEADNGGSKAKKDKAGKTVIKKSATKAEVKAAAKAAKAVAEPVVLPPVKLVAGVKAAIADAGGLIAAAKTLADRSGATDFTFGGVLARIQETSAFEELVDGDNQPIYGVGQVGFARFVEAHLGMKYRKAQYLIQLYTKFTGLGMTEKQILGIGWSKLVQALNVITEDNVEDILAEAKAKPYDEFKAAMKQRLVDAGGPQHGNSKASMTTFTFRLHNDKAEVAKEALNKAKEVLEISGNDVHTQSLALDHIISEWMSMKD